MKYQLHHEANYIVLALEGEFDLSSSPKVRESLLANLNKRKDLLMDLSAVSYIDSSGIACMVEALQLAQQRALKFGCVHISQAVRKVLTLARLDQVFPIYTSIDDFTDAKS